MSDYPLRVYCGLVQWDKDSLPGLGSWLASSITVVPAKAQKFSSLPIKAKGLKVHAELQMVLAHKPFSTCTHRMTTQTTKSWSLIPPFVKLRKKRNYAKKIWSASRGKDAIAQYFAKIPHPLPIPLGTLC